ncbi:MAG TPA: hypothetical protein VH912_26065 [Streptosporangiaceae bacterium]|jgi:hypothetical protein
MYVIRLPNGNLRVPHSAVADDESTGQVIGQAYIEIGPDDPDYSRFAEQALTEEELAEKRRGWREGDEALLRQFEEWKTQQSGD